MQNQDSEVDGSRSPRGRCRAKSAPGLSWVPQLNFQVPSKWEYIVCFLLVPAAHRKGDYVRRESRSLRASLSAVTVCGAEGQFKSSEVPRAPSAPPSETGIFCSFFFFLILIWSFSVYVAAFSPDASSEGNVLSDRGTSGKLKWTGEKDGEWETKSQCLLP